MFCPKCGNAEQQINTYCRTCGMFLPDFDKIKHEAATPEQHIVVNSVLSSISAIVSIGLAITLYAMFLGKDDTPFIIYLTAGFLTAVFFWQVQIIIRTYLLKKQLPKRNLETNEENAQTIEIEGLKAERFLNEADQSKFISPNTLKRTTRKLKIEK